MDHLFYTMWWALVVFAMIFSLFGLEAFCTDLYYLINRLWRYVRYRHCEPLTYEKLSAKSEQKIAIMVPCWQESGVIAEMLRTNIRNIDYDNYTIFVGLYPNDPLTLTAVEQVAAHLPKVRYVVGGHPGPTTKSDNLNAIYGAIIKEEAKTGQAYEIVVLHDSEDIIHSLSLKLYNYLLPAEDMVQIPVFPLAVNYGCFTHWIYNDEFAENHTKDMVVREKMGGFVPSAGVGTAFSRQAIAHVVAQSDAGIPFELGQLTEDYHTALKLKMYGMRAIFVTQSIMCTRRLKNLWGNMCTCRIREQIATRALFPKRYLQSVRQKSRWITGIALQEWQETGWVGNIATRYHLLSDRKALFTHLANGGAYIVLLFWIFYAWWQAYYPTDLSLSRQIAAYPFVRYLIIIATTMMAERLFFRMFACWRIYGCIPALLSIPRVIYGNFLNLHALLRAYRHYFFRPAAQKTLKWDKTDHSFIPNKGLQATDKKLGSYLVEAGYVTPDALTKLITRHYKTGEKLGQAAVKNGLLTPAQLAEMLAKQYDLPFLPKPPEAMPPDRLPHVRAKDYRWLLKNGCIPVKFTETGGLQVGIVDPTDAACIQGATMRLSAYPICFVMYVFVERF